MDWLHDVAYLWYERNSPLIAAIEFAVLAVFGPGRLILTYLLSRRTRKIEERVETLLQETAASEASAERRHRELVDLRSVLGKVDMQPLGDSARIGRLPDGTNVVEMLNGQIRRKHPRKTAG